MSKKIIYITDLSLPSDKAQAVHIFKLIDNSLKFLDKAILICPNMKKKLMLIFSENTLIYIVRKISKYTTYLKIYILIPF